MLQTYCLKGVGAQEGTFLVEPRLRSRVRSRRSIWLTRLPSIGEFDVIFLRNVMIYFDHADQARSRRQCAAAPAPRRAT